MKIIKSKDSFLFTIIYSLTLFCLFQFHLFAAHNEGPKLHYFSTPKDASLKDQNFAGRGPVRVHLPRQYRKYEKLPLILSLHGFGSSPLLHEGLFNIRKLVSKKKFILATLPGGHNKTGIRFWNAGDWCCDFFKSGRDDESYILHVLKRLKEIYNVDEKKVIILGHSNGGFMGYRMLCHYPEVFSGVISLAGAMPKGITPCKQAKGASILQIHGKDDVVIKYKGTPNHVAAKTTTRFWTNAFQCTQEPSKINNRIIVKLGQWPKRLNKKTWSQCSESSKVALWSISREGHIIDLTNLMRSRMIDFALN